MGEITELRLRASYDVMLAELMREVGFHQNIRYDPLREIWYYWDPAVSRWRVDRTQHVFNLLREQAQKLAAAWVGGGESEQAKFLLPLFNRGKQESVLKVLSAYPDTVAQTMEWDRDPLLLGFENGILNVATGEFDSRPSKDLLISKSVGYNWDPTAECPEFDKFMVSIFPKSPEVREYVLRVLSLGCLGLASERKFWLWIGRGSNGKSVLARTIVDVLGDYAETPPATLYMRTRFGAAPASAARPDLMRLFGVRFVALNEPPGGHFDEVTLKAHTGGDLIFARDLYTQSSGIVRFYPTHTIVFLTNDPPKTDDVGPSMRYRARAIYFEEEFTGSRADPEIGDRLRAEKPGIIRKLASLAREWYETRDLREPAAVTAWSAEYIASNDPLADWLAEECVVAPTEKSLAAPLYASYTAWARRNEIEPMTQHSFGRKLGQRFKKTRVAQGAQYSGLCLRSEIEVAPKGPWALPREEPNPWA